MTFHGEPLNDPSAVLERGDTNNFMTPQSTPSVDVPANPLSLQAQETPRVIVINSIPLASPEATEETLVNRFTHYGDIERMAVERGDSTQSAFILFKSQQSVEVAEQRFSGELLGAHVTLTRFESTSPRTTEPLAQAVSEGTAVVLAGSLLVGRQAVKALRTLDEAAGVSKTLVQVDKQNHISENLAKGAQAVVHGIKDVDDNLKISSTITKTAMTVAGKALQNPFVAVGAEKTGQVIGGLTQWIGSTVQMAKEMVKDDSSRGAAPAATPTLATTMAIGEQQQQQNQGEEMVV